MIEEMGKKTGAWTSTTSWDVNDITAENLKQYDAIFLSNTTGTFLDDPNDQAVTDARRKAFQDFLMSGKGVAGIHATGDSYHGGRGDGRAGAGATGGAAPQPRLPPRRRAARGRAAAGGGRGDADALLGVRSAEAGASGRAAVAVVGRSDRRLLQVPLELSDADHGEDRRSEEPADRGVPGQVVQHDRRGLHVQRELVLARARARAHQRRLQPDERLRQGHRGRARARTTTSRSAGFRRSDRAASSTRRSATTSRSTTTTRTCWRTSSPACSTRSAI